MSSAKNQRPAHRAKSRGKAPDDWEILNALTAPRSISQAEVRAFEALLGADWPDLLEICGGEAPVL
jgi:hypothetical protein